MELAAYRKEIPVSLVIFDQLELAEKSVTNPLNVLYSKLESIYEEDNINFIGFSNYSLNPKIMNRALVLSDPDLDCSLDDLKETSRVNILSRTYFSYKEILKAFKELIVLNSYFEKYLKNQKNLDRLSFKEIKRKNEFINLLKKENKIPTNFHGYRDFYNLIKGIVIEFQKLDIPNDKDKISIIENYIERNFGGIDYEIDINLNLKLDDIRRDIHLIKDILYNYEYFNFDKKIKISSFYIFKILYNREFERDDPNSNLKLDKFIINNYNLNNCINNNIKDEINRYLLIEINPSLTALIYHHIKFNNKNKTIITYVGSPFQNDYNKEYILKIINKIQDDASDDKLIILENLNPIYPFLFDLFNMNYTIIDEKKYTKMSSDTSNEQLFLVNNNFRIIILVDNISKNKVDLSFINRFEKISISLDKLLDDKLKRMARYLIQDIKLNNTIEKFRDINYSLNDYLLIVEMKKFKG